MRNICPNKLLSALETITSMGTKLRSGLRHGMNWPVKKVLPERQVVWQAEMRCHTPSMNWSAQGYLPRRFQTFEQMCHLIFDCAIKTKQKGWHAAIVVWRHLQHRNTRDRSALQQILIQGNPQKNEVESKAGPAEQKQPYICSKCDRNL